MISLLLTILKIIGITLLVILGIILLVLSLILFVPVRYRAIGNYYDQNTYAVEGRITWLLHVISAKAVYHANQPFRLCLRLFGIPIYDNLKTGTCKIRNKKAKTTQDKSDTEAELKAASITPLSEEAEKILTEEFGELQAEKTITAPQTQQEENDLKKTPVHEDGQKENKKQTTQKDSFFQKMKTGIANFVNIFKNIKFTIRKIYDTMVRIKDNIRYYLKVLQLDSTKQAFATCQKQLLMVFKNLCPKKFQVNLHLGFEDPSVMGDILAVWGMLYPFHQGNIDIQPDFEKTVIEGNFFIKGRVSIYVLVWTALILLYDRNIKLLVKHLKRNN